MYSKANPQPLLSQFTLTGSKLIDFEVTGHTGDAVVVERLKELGLCQGAKISFNGRAPFSGPLLFRLGAMVLALREEEALCLILKPL